jgi:hypothetical protein
MFRSNDLPRDADVLTKISIWLRLNYVVNHFYL